MRLFRASQPQQSAEDRAAAVRLMAVASRSKEANSYDLASIAKRECPSAN